MLDILESVIPNRIPGCTLCQLQLSEYARAIPLHIDNHRQAKQQRESSQPQHISRVKINRVTLLTMREADEGFPTMDKGIPDIYQKAEEKRFDYFVEVALFTAHSDELNKIRSRKPRQQY